MSYVLGYDRQMSDDIDALFDTYLAMLERNRDALKESVYAIISNRRWYRYDGYGPHDSSLVSLLMEEVPPANEEDYRRLDITVTLRGGEISRIIYRDVTGYDLANNPGIPSLHGQWTYDEFVPSGNGAFRHTIQWCEGAQWWIEAEDLEIIRREP